MIMTIEEEIESLKAQADRYQHLSMLTNAKECRILVEWLEELAKLRKRNTSIEARSMTMYMYEISACIDVVDNEGREDTKVITIYKDALTANDGYALEEITIPGVPVSYEVECAREVDESELRCVTIKDTGIEFFVYIDDLDECVEILRYYGYEVNEKTWLEVEMLNND